MDKNAYLFEKMYFVADEIKWDKRLRLKAIQELIENMDIIGKVQKNEPIIGKQ